MRSHPGIDSTPLRNLRLIGLLTWFLVGIPSIVSGVQDGSLFTIRGAAWVTAFLAFAVLFWFSTRAECRLATRIPAIVMQTALWIVCVYFNPGGLLGVLSVIIAVQLGMLALPFALGWIVVQTAALTFLLSNDRRSAFPIAMSYFAFQLFALYTARIANRESEARREVAEAHTKLKIASGLLEISSRSEERLRIARDLHDLLGHHLTALSLNLEVASHLTQGEAREQVEKSKTIARRLLGDVRGVVERLRNEEPLDLAGAVEALGEVLTKPRLVISLEGDLTITDPSIATTALRSLQEIATNSMRHGNAAVLSLHIERVGEKIRIDASDDGIGTDHVVPGNGLRGMRERIAAVGGSMEIRSARDRGFAVLLELPVEAVG